MMNRIFSLRLPTLLIMFFLGWNTNAPGATVYFIVTNQANNGIFVAGDFNDWNSTSFPLREREPNVWYGETDVAGPEHAYKVVIDGNWQLDPGNPATMNVDGVVNSRLVASDRNPASGPYPEGPQTEVLEPITRDAYRTWTARSGKTLEAKLDAVQGEQVILSTRDGRQIRIHTNALMPEDIALARSLDSDSGELMAMVAPTDNIRRGLYTATFTKPFPEGTMKDIYDRLQLDKPPHLKRDDRINLAEEQFELYVPEDYDPATPYGLVVWIDASDSGVIPMHWRSVLDQNRLIWVGAKNSGNDRGIQERRIPLALEAMYNARLLFAIDPKRVYLAGISGGGRVVSRMVFSYADLFTGGIFVIGADAWEDVPVLDKPGYVWPKDFPEPRSKYMNSARKDNRYVMLTGDLDMNRGEMQSIYDHVYSRALRHVVFYQVPNMGHDQPPSQWFDKAIRYLDGQVEE